MSAPETPIATIRASHRTGHAVVTVERCGRPAHRYRVSLRRYHALREWTLGPLPWRTSGAWLRNGMTACLWPLPSRELLARIMQLEAHARPCDAVRLRTLRTQWSNRVLAPSDYPSRR